MPLYQKSGEQWQAGAAAETTRDIRYREGREEGAWNQPDRIAQGFYDKKKPCKISLAKLPLKPLRP
jgi:hypothetical protein